MIHENDGRRRMRWAVVLGLILGSGAQGSERTIEHGVVVDAPRSQVWKALTTTQGVTTFFAPNAHVELRSGGPFEIYFSPDAPEGSRGSEGCRVLSYVQGEMLCFSWNAPPKFLELRGKRTFVVVRLSDAGQDRTGVQLTNGGYQSGEQWDELYAYFDNAWPRVLENLRRRFDTGPLWSDGERGQIERTKRNHYVYFINPVRDDFEERPVDAEREPLQGHVNHIRQLLAGGRLILAGPCLDPPQYPSGETSVKLEMPSPGIVVFEAKDDAEAKRIMEADPAVKAGVFKARVSRFVYSFARP